MEIITALLKIDWFGVLGALVALLSAAIALATLIPGDEPERTLKLQHPKLAGRSIEKIQLLDYRMDTGRGYAPARPQDHRPTEPFGRGVDTLS